MTLPKCAPAATIVTPPANRPFDHAEDMQECRIVATLPSLSTAVTWLLPGGGDVLVGELHRPGGLSRA